jgi:hypothetical protein
VVRRRRRRWESQGRGRGRTRVRGDEFLQVKKSEGFFVKMLACRLFRDGGSTKDGIIFD